MDAATKISGGDVAKKGKIHSGQDQLERPANKRVAEKAVRLGPLPRYYTIGKIEKRHSYNALKNSLSGYIGGNRKAGYWCERLSAEWSAAFNIRYSIPCNSATSGLLAACMAAGIKAGDEVWVSDYTMSASATCALILGAKVTLLDVDDHFCLLWHQAGGSPVPNQWPKAIIVTNLFGCPADLHYLRKLCDINHIILIEDNAQAPFATLNGKYTGTIGHIGVFSLNVHKHLQTGEGGVIVTDDPQLAHKIDCAINHGELMGSDPHLGLNLRMTEPIAGIACAQLQRGHQLVQGRIRLAEEITSMFEHIDCIHTPRLRPDSQHVYYMWAGQILGSDAGIRRKRFIEAVQARGVPFREGYSRPLHRILGIGHDSSFPNTVYLEDRSLFTFEICAYDPKTQHLAAMRQIIDDESKRL